MGRAEDPLVKHQKQSQNRPEADHRLITQSAARRKAEKKKLTDRLIRAIEPGKETRWVYDTEVPFLGLRTMTNTAICGSSAGAAPKNELR